MQAPAVIKTDISPNTSNIKAQSAVNSGSEAFSAEFDKQLSNAETQQVQTKNVKNQSTSEQDKISEQEKVSDQNGKKLPTDESVEVAEKAEKPVEKKTDNNKTSTLEAEPTEEKIIQPPVDGKQVEVETLTINTKVETKSLPIEAEVTREQDAPVIVDQDVPVTEAEQEGVKKETSSLTQKELTQQLQPTQLIGSETADSAALQTEATAKQSEPVAIVVNSKAEKAVIKTAQQDSQANTLAQKTLKETSVTKEATTTLTQGQSQAETQLVNNKAEAEGIETAKNAVMTNQSQNKSGHVVKADAHATQQADVVRQAATETQVLKEQVVKTINDSEIKAADKPVSLRADIQEALNKQVKMAGNDVEATLKNKLTAHYQEGKALEIEIPKNALLAQNEAAQDKNSALFHQPTTARFSASTLSATSAGTTTVNSTPTAANLDIQPSVQSAGWSKVMASRVVWMVKEGVQRAEIKLTPASMGSIEVKVSVQNEQVSVSFHAQNAATRDALEQSIPRLRESFADSGIQLADAEVGEQTQQQHKDEQQSGHSSGVIFSQENSGEDDIEIGTKIEQDSAMGLSLYA